MKNRVKYEFTDYVDRAMRCHRRRPRFTAAATRRHTEKAGGLHSFLGCALHPRLGPERL